VKHVILISAVVALVGCVSTPKAVPNSPEAKAAPDFSRGGKIHIAAIQTTSVRYLAENQATMERLIREAASRGARYILLPEYYPAQLNNAPGTPLKEVRAGAETLDGPLARHMLDLCRELGVYIGFPLAERRGDGHIYNSTIYAGPNGIEGVYSKRILINLRKAAKRKAAAPKKPQRPRPYAFEEDEIYTYGKTDGVMNWGGVRIGALICADGAFPNLYLARVNKNVQLLCHPSGSAGVKKGGHNPMPNEAARRYHTPVLFANHYVRTIVHRGNSQICDTKGNILAHIGPKSDVVIDAVVTLAPLDAGETGADDGPSPPPQQEPDPNK
jgi:predicted amidohydrolase